MKNFKTYFGAISLILLTAQCSFFPWNPLEPQIEPEPIEYSNYSVVVGDTVTVSFRANGTTGYQWRWDNNANCTSVDSVGFGYIVDPSELGPNGEIKCGVPGTECWIFKGVNIGTDTLDFSYLQPFDANSIPAKTKRVIIHVYEVGNGSNKCNVTNPAEEIGWLKNAIDSVKQDEYAYYMMANYKGETVFYYGNCNPAANYISTIQNCNGEKLGYTSEKQDELTDETVLWKHEDSKCEF